MVNIWGQSLVDQLTLRLQRKVPVVIVLLWMLHKQALLTLFLGDKRFKKCRVKCKVDEWFGCCFMCKTWILSKCKTATPFSNRICHLGNSQNIHFRIWLMTQWVVRGEDIWGYIKRIVEIMSSTRKKPSSSGSSTLLASRSSRLTGLSDSFTFSKITKCLLCKFEQRSFL